MDIVFNGEVGHSSTKNIGRDKVMKKPDHSSDIINFYIWYLINQLEDTLNTWNTELVI